jgi:hypothetical protein
MSLSACTSAFRAVNGMPGVTIPSMSGPCASLRGQPGTRWPGQWGIVASDRPIVVLSFSANPPIIPESAISAAHTFGSQDGRLA